MLTNEEIQNIVLLELMSTNPDEEVASILTTEEQDAIHERWAKDISSKDWKYILEPIQNPTTRSRFISLMQELDKDERD